jgi:hypothetical protein
VESNNVKYTDVNLINRQGIDMNAKKGVVAGFSAGIAMVLSGILVWGMTQGYLMPEYEASAALWKPMEPLSTWLAQVWTMTVLEGILYGLVYSVFYNGIPGKNINKGLNFAVILWLVGTVPGMAMTYLSMAVPNPIIISWVFGGLINLLVMGAVLAIVYERVK